MADEEVSINGGNTVTRTVGYAAGVLDLFHIGHFGDLKHAIGRSDGNTSRGKVATRAGEISSHLPHCEGSWVLSPPSGAPSLPVDPTCGAES